MSESSLYKELGILTKKKDQWEENIPYISSLLSHDSVKIQAKALWLLAEMGLAYPQSVRDSVPAIVSFLNSSVPLLRERALNAIGRIGRGDYRLVEPYWAGLFRFADDEEFVQVCSEIIREMPSFRIRYAKLEVLSETSIIVAVPSKPDALLALHNKIAEKYSHFMVLPGGGYVTIEIRLPENWDALIAPMGYEPLSHFVLDEDK